MSCSRSHIRDTQLFYIVLRVELHDRNVFNGDAMKILVRSGGRWPTF